MSYACSPSVALGWGGSPSINTLKVLKTVLLAEPAIHAIYASQTAEIGMARELVASRGCAY